MTAEADGLLAAGALLSKEAPDLVDRSNVSLPHLEAFARHAVAEFAPRLKEQPLLPKQLQIFDFSERRQSNLASIVVPAERFGGSKEKRLVVTRVGDALQEPFWPEGLGINRGFLHCFDCADLVQGYCSLLQQHGRQVQPKGASAGDAQIRERADAAAAVLQRREELFGLVKRVSGTNRLTELKPTRDAKAKAASYSVDPASRYVHLPRTLPPASY